MLQIYSNDIDLDVPATGAAYVPFNNVSKAKGCDSRLIAPGTVQIDRQGVYHVSVTGTAAGTAGDYFVQLYVNGVAQPETLKRVTLAAAAYSTLALDDYVTVRCNNTNCCYSSPTLVQLGISSAAGTAGTVDLANISLQMYRAC